MLIAVCVAIEIWVQCVVIYTYISWQHCSKWKYGLAIWSGIRNIWLATTESIYLKAIFAHACLYYVGNYNLWRVRGIHKSAAEDLRLLLGILHHVGCYIVPTGKYFGDVTPCRLTNSAVLLKEHGALFLRTSSPKRTLCRLTLKMKAPRSFETSTIIYQSSRPNI